MLAYVTQWRDIRRIWTIPTAPEARMKARIEGDQEYLRQGLANIWAAPFGYVRRRATRGIFVLWAGEVPIRYSQINQVPRWIVIVIWLLQIALVMLASLGWWRVWHDGHHVLAGILAAPLVYVTAVHLPLLTEARQSLPVKPLLLIFAAIGLQVLLARQARNRRTTSKPNASINSRARIHAQPYRVTAPLLDPAGLFLHGPSLYLFCTYT
jgi:hypothetical protein